MEKIYFATTNEGKIAEARLILGMDIEPIPLEIDEIQSLDPIKVALKKAKAYFKELEKPLFVEDVSLSFSSLGGLPGPYINDFSKALGNYGLIALLRGTENRTAIAQVTIVYIGENSQETIFEGKIEGEITKEPIGTSGFGWDPIFIPSGANKTFAEMTIEEKNNYSMRVIAFNKFKLYLQKIKATTL